MALLTLLPVPSSATDATITGLRLGMSIADAKSTVKSRDPKFNFFVPDTNNWRSIVGDGTVDGRIMGGEIFLSKNGSPDPRISVFVALSPDKEVYIVAAIKEVVYYIMHAVHFVKRRGIKFSNFSRRSHE
jgi:hypothetical protein